jgi:hypothetical protein
MGWHKFGYIYRAGSNEIGKKFVTTEDAGMAAPLVFKILSPPACELFP